MSARLTDGTPASAASAGRDGSCPLGDPRFMFDSSAFFEQPDDGVATITSHTDLAFMGDMKPILQIDFPAGLSSADSFTFQVRIASTATSQLADYASSLWHKEFATLPNRLDNALVSAIYQDTVAGAPLTPSMIPVRLFEYPRRTPFFQSTQTKQVQLRRSRPTNEEEYRSSSIVFADGDRSRDRRLGIGCDVRCCHRYFRDAQSLNDAQALSSRCPAKNLAVARHAALDNAQASERPCPRRRPHRRSLRRCSCGAAFWLDCRRSRSTAGRGMRGRFFDRLCPEDPD
jgi:hypothetical protein